MTIPSRADRDARTPSPARHRRAGTAVLAKGRRRSEQILDAATALLVEEGHAALSTRKIAARVGIRPGHLQYYYRTKHDVVRALLDRCLERSTAAVEARMASSAGAPEARLRAGLDGILADQRSVETCDLFREVWALAARDRAVAAGVNGFYEAFRDGVARALLAVQPALGAARARRRATLIVALIEGLTVFRFTPSGRLAGEAALAQELQSLVGHLATEIDA